MSADEFVEIKERYVDEVLERLRSLARQEAAMLFAESARDPSVRWAQPSAPSAAARSRSQPPALAAVCSRSQPPAPSAAVRSRPQPSTAALRRR